MAMFVKRMKKKTLDEYFQATVKVEKEFLSGHGKYEMDNDKTRFSSKWETSKDTFDKKEQNSFDLENMSRVIKRLANDVLDFKKWLLRIHIDLLKIHPLENIIHPRVRLQCLWMRK